MFKKLRQRIESDVPNPPENSSASMQATGRRADDGRRASRTLQLQTNLKRTDSLNSLNSVDDAPIESSSKEDLYAALMQRTTQVKRLEVKLAEYGQSLKEKSRECEKLSNALEKQQDSSLRKLNRLNETFSNEKKRYEATIARLEDAERDLSISVDQLKEQNEALQTRVTEWDVEKDDFDKQKKEFYEKRDNSEELHDLQRQELAKLKHMLMNSEKNVKKLQLDLDENLANLLQSRDRNDELESHLREVNAAFETTKTSLREAVTEKEKISESVERMETTNKKLTSENANLKDKLSSLALDLQKTRSSLASVESSHSSLADKYDYLKHTSEAILNKVQSDMEEKESLIRHLEDKVKMLEQRSVAENLPQDEQVQALISERSSLEEKLEESRQQLVNIKSTWSDKINQLETQVSHLNSKIVEDCEEFCQKNNELDRLKTETKAQIESLTIQVNSLKESNIDLSTHNEGYLLQMTELEAKIIEQQAVHDISLSKSKKNETNMEEKARSIEKDLRIRIDDLSRKLDDNASLIASLKNQHENTLEEHKNEAETLESRVETLQEELEKKTTEIGNREKINSEMALSLEEVRRERDELRKTKDIMESEMTNYQDDIQCSKNNCIQLSADLESLKNTVSDLESELEATTKKLTEAQQDCDEKREGLLLSKGSSNEMEEQLHALGSKLSETELQLENRTKELMTCKEEVASLKNNQSEEGEEVKMLRMERSVLEERILEKDRTLKLHQQRLSDIKKTLQKEINKKHSIEAARANDVEPSSSQRSSSKSRLSSSSSSGTNANHSRYNGQTTESDPLPSLLSGNMSLDDPSLSNSQREVVIKYLKHVVLTFLSCGQSEALQLIKAISAILHFTADEEKLVRDVLEYRKSWFASRPNAKGVIKPSVKGKGRHHR